MLPRWPALALILLAPTPAAAALDAPDPCALAPDAAAAGCALVAHLVAHPCDAPGVDYACDAVAAPCRAPALVALVPGRPLGDGREAVAACEGSDLVPVQPAAWCGHALCRWAATGGGGAVARWEAPGVPCGEADLCYAPTFVARAEAALPGAWALAHRREIREGLDDRLVAESAGASACAWVGPGACEVALEGPALQLAPSSQDARAHAWHELWWRDDAGHWHLQAQGYACTHLPAPGSRGSC